MWIGKARSYTDNFIQTRGITGATLRPEPATPRSTLFLGRIVARWVGVRRVRHQLREPRLDHKPLDSKPASRTPILPWPTG